jgi:hypothetical protein
MTISILGQVPHSEVSCAPSAPSLPSHRLDDIRVDPRPRAEPLGATPVGRIYLGEGATGRTYLVAAKDTLRDWAPGVLPTEIGQ